MRRGPWDLGDGEVVRLDEPGDLPRLERRLRGLVSDRLVERWRGAPASIEAAADEVASPALAAWLRRAAGARISIAVFDVRVTARPRAFLEFDFGPRPSPHAGPLPWQVLVDCREGTPPGCPPALAEVYAAIGGLVTQYGASPWLFAPDEVEPLARLTDLVPHLMEPGRWATGALDRWFPYFYADGDVLCYHVDHGASRWFGDEWGERPERATGEMLDRLFTDLANEDPLLRSFVGGA